MRKAVALRHLAFEDLGLIEPWLVQRGWDVRYLDVGVDDLGALDLDATDLMVVLGGPIGAEDDAQYPWLTDETKLVAQRIESGRAILGVCLGAQLMARALGGSVRAMGHKEIGFSALDLTPAAAGTPLALIGPQPVLHWHGDELCVPEGTNILATTPECTHQAFMAGRDAMAWQFHLEVNPARFEQWLIGHALELSEARQDLDALRDDARKYRQGLAEALDRVLTAWLR